MFKLCQTQTLQDFSLSQPLLTEHFDYGTSLNKGQSSNSDRGLEFFRKKNPSLEMEVVIIELCFFCFKNQKLSDKLFLDNF